MLAFNIVWAAGTSEVLLCFPLLESGSGAQESSSRTSGLGCDSGRGSEVAIYLEL